MNRLLGSIKVVDVPTNGANFIRTVVRCGRPTESSFHGKKLLTFPHDVDDHRLQPSRVIQLSSYQWLALVLVVPSAGCFVDFCHFFFPHAVVDRTLLPDSNKRIAVWQLHLPSSSIATLSFFVLRRFVHLLNRRTRPMAQVIVVVVVVRSPLYRLRTTSMGASWRVPSVTSTDRIVLRR